MATRHERLDIQPAYLRLIDIERLTGLSMSHVRNEIARGHLDAYKVGKSVLVPTESVHRWIRGTDPKNSVATDAD